MFRTISLTIFLCLLLSSCSCHSIRKEARILNKAINKDLTVYNTDSSLARAYRLKSITSLSLCRKEHIASLVYIGESYLIKGISDSVSYYLSTAEELAKKYSDYFSLGIIYNSYGVECSKKAEFGNAVKNFYQAMTYARKSGNDQIMMSIKYNLAIMYYMRQDPNGLSFALDVYNYGINNNDSTMLYLGAIRASYMYWFLDKTDSAVYYIEKALPMAPGREEEYNLYTLYGDILLNQGNDNEAARMYHKVIHSSKFRQGLAGTDIYLSYGRYLKQKEDYDSALSVITEGIAVADTSFYNVNSHLLFREASEICSLMYDMTGYSRYKFLYEKYNDEIFNYKKERDISDSELEIARTGYEESIRLANRKNAFVFISLTLLAATAIVILLLIYSSKINKQKARQEHTGADYIQIFKKLESLMSDNKIYRDRNITRERIAEILSTNKTYITRAVHESSGMNLAAYINSYRIKEAIQILSNPEDTRPIKEIVSYLGFSSISNFYKLFSESTGVSPSQFRKQNS